MPRTIAQNLKLYTAYPLSLRERAGVRVTSPYSEPALLAVLDPSGIRSLQHDTRLPGGFDELSLTIAATESEFRDWRQDRLLDRLVLEEPSGRTIWEGTNRGRRPRRQVAGISHRSRLLVQPDRLGAQPQLRERR